MFFTSLKKRSTLPSLKLELFPFLQPVPYSLLMQTAPSFFAELLKKATTNKLLQEEKINYLACLSEYRLTRLPTSKADGKNHAQLMLRAQILIHLSISTELDLKLAWYNLVGLIAHELQHYQEAQNHFEAALKLADDLAPLSKASLFSNLARTFSAQQQVQQAAAMHKKAIACLEDLIFIRIEEQQAAAIYRAAVEGFNQAQLAAEAQQALKKVQELNSSEAPTRSAAKADKFFERIKLTSSEKLSINNFFRPWTLQTTSEEKKNKLQPKPTAAPKI